MLPLTQFSIPFLNDFDIKGEYEGNEATNKVVIFSHGFGVKRNSWGMFTEIGDSLKHDSIVIRFDYNQIDDHHNATHVIPTPLQSQMLEKVIRFAQQEFQLSEITIIAHSMGCFVAGLLQPHNINQTILLAPPITPTYNRLKAYFSKRPGTKIDENGLSVIERSDGSTTYVPAEFWSGIKDTSPMHLYTKLSEITNLYVIKPMQDQVITEENYSEIQKLLQNKYIEINGSHDFVPPHRQKLIDTIKQIVINDSPLS